MWGAALFPGAGWGCLAGTGGIYGALALVWVRFVSLSVGPSWLCSLFHIFSFATVLDWRRKARTFDLCP